MTLIRSLPLFPLEQVVLFPGMTLPLHVFEERYKRMMAAVTEGDGTFGVCLIRAGREVGAAAVPEEVGCTARVETLRTEGDGRILLLALGEQRFHLLGPPGIVAGGYLEAQVEVFAEDEESGDVLVQLAASVSGEFAHYWAEIAQLMERGGGSDRTAPSLPSEPGKVAFAVAAALRSHPRERQRLLECATTRSRLQRELRLLRRERQTVRLMAAARGRGEGAGPFSLN